MYERPFFIFKRLNVRALAVIQPNELDLVDIPKPEPHNYEVLIKTEISFICNATDRKLIEGHFPGLQGKQNYPLLLGHETAGIVESVGNKVRSFIPGDRVIGGLLLSPADKKFTSGWGGMSEYVLAVDEKAMLADRKTTIEDGYDELWQIMKKVPSEIPVEAAGLLCTWREVYAGIQDFMLTNDKELLIFGAGPVGLSFVRFLKILGFPYIACVDPIDKKREKAEEMGADETFSPDSKDLKNLISKRAKKLDAVIDAVGSEAIINSGLEMLKMAGSMCVYGVIGKPQITIDKFKAPYNFNLLIHQWPTRELEAAAQDPLCDWIISGDLDYKDFLSAEYPIVNFKDAFNNVKNGSAIKTMLRW